jgi:hypothetical protein
VVFLPKSRKNLNRKKFTLHKKNFFFCGVAEKSRLKKKNLRKSAVAQKRVRERKLSEKEKEREKQKEIESEKERERGIERPVFLAIVSTF